MKTGQTTFNIAHPENNEIIGEVIITSRFLDESLDKEFTANLLVGINEAGVIAPLLLHVNIDGKPTKYPITITQ